VILRRVQFADGRTRAFVNDQPVSVQVLRSIGGCARRDPRPARRPRPGRSRQRIARILDGYGALQDQARGVMEAARAWREARTALDRHAARVEAARKEADFLRHAVEELSALAPEAGEEEALAERRQTMMASEKIAQDLVDAFEVVGGQSSVGPVLSAALRKLERRSRAGARRSIDPEREGARRGARRASTRPATPSRPRIRAAEFDPRELERDSRSGCSPCAPRRANTTSQADGSRGFARALRRRSSLPIDAGEAEMARATERRDADARGRIRCQPSREGSVGRAPPGGGSARRGRPSGTAAR
jgi:DNA repair protein RecN (Recombination protein N)